MTSQLILRSAFGLVLVTFLLVTGNLAPIAAQDAMAVAQKAIARLGIDSTTSVSYGGSGSAYAFGQSVSPSSPYPLLARIRTQVRDVDLTGMEARVRATYVAGGPSAGDARHEVFTSKDS